MDPWEMVLSSISSENVKFVFGIGDTLVNLLAAKTPSVTPINLRYEGSAPFMAMAYARLSGRTGVCTGSSGPGVANMIPGVLEAYSACSPLVMPCQFRSIEDEGMGEFQECDQVSLMKPVTKWSVRVSKAERTAWFMRRAFSIAINGQPGPVFLELPLDVCGYSVLSQHFGKERTDFAFPPYVPAKRMRSAADLGIVAQAVSLLLRAQRPVVVAGGGAVLSQAFEELKEFVEVLGIPFLTTPCGRGILPEDHPLALGLVGIYRTESGKRTYLESDLLITIGSRNEESQTHRWKDFPQCAKFIQIDIDPFEIGRNWIPDVGIVGDAKLVLRQLVDNILTKRGKRDFRNLPRIKELQKAKLEYEKRVESECMVKAMPIPTKRVVRELNKVFGRRTILVNENGGLDCWSYCFPYYTVLDELGCVPVAEQTCMGMGVVGAIASKLTRPDMKVVCITGDGAFQMYMKELATAAQYDVGCTWVVLNNFSLGYIKNYQIAGAGWDTASFSVQPDFVRIAEANKCYGEKIERVSEIEGALRRALEANSERIPAVLDFIVEPLDMTHFQRAEDC